jgi:hypothetical protein
MTRSGGRLSSRVRARRWAAAIAGVTSLLVWNVVFDLWLGQGERQYLWEHAKYQLGQGPDVSLKGSMESSMRDAFWVATAWAIVVAAAILLASYLSYRFARQQSDTPTAGRAGL